MTLDKDDLKAIGDLMDTKMIDFHSKVTELMIENVMKILRSETRELGSNLGNSIENLENGYARLERKIDNITDMLADKVTDHEQRITKLELSVA